ncbi:MAG TPA: diguanylate cyclase, partial [Humisphaera sp.]
MGYFVLRHHLDLIGFAVLAVAGLLALDRWVRRTTGRAARLGPATWAGLLAIVVGGVIAGTVAGRWIDRRLRDMIGGLAPTYADQLARLGHDRVTPDTPADDPTYLALVEAERRWQRLNPFVADIYTFGRRPDGTIVLLVDAETDYDHNGRYEGAREQRTPVGEPYAADTETINRAFAGEAVFTEHLVTDRWGTWVSTYVPMRSADGRVSAVLGVDFPADQWVGSILVHRGAMLGLAGTLATTLAGAAAVTRVTRAEARRREAAHRRAATHDGLTGLPNRLLFRERLDAAVAAARRDPDARSAVLFLDCD